MTHSTGLSQPSVAPATWSPYRPDQASSTLLLLGGGPLLAAMLSGLSDALGLDLQRAESVASLDATLHIVRPIGLACGLEGTGPTTACHAVKAVARYDAGLPMLMISDEDPETLGSLDAIAALCGLSDLQRLTAPPRMEEVLAFLARAGRRSGRLSLVPVG